MLQFHVCFFGVENVTADRFKRRCFEGFTYRFFTKDMEYKHTAESKYIERFCWEFHGDIYRDRKIEKLFFIIISRVMKFTFFFFCFLFLIRLIDRVTFPLFNCFFSFFFVT